MGNYACFCKFDNSKPEPPPKSIKVNPKFKPKPMAVVPIVRKHRKLTFTEGEYGKKSKVDISELDCYFGIEEADESKSECNNDNNLIDVSPKLIPHNINKFIMSIQERITEDEYSNNSSACSDEESANGNALDSTTLKAEKKNSTPKPKRKEPILLPKDLSGLSLGHSHKILIGKLKEMGFSAVRAKTYRPKNRFCF